MECIPYVQFKPAPGTLILQLCRGFCYPKGCAGVVPATTQRVSPRLLPLALVYTTEFHPNGHGKTRTCIPGSCM